MEQMLHGKSKGGKVFAAFFRKLRGEANIGLLIVVLISSANYHLRLIYCKWLT